MEISALKSEELKQEKDGDADLRGAPRFTLLIRAAKIISDQGEFVGVIRDVSSTGVSVRLFHKISENSRYALELQSGEQFEVETVWQNPREVGFKFAKDVPVERFVSEVGEFPKRGIRLSICFPVTLFVRGERHEALIVNISQQGARIQCDSMFAIDQGLTLDGEGLSEVRAKIRWRGHGNYGVVFDDTFTLSEFAKLAVRLQAPVLLEE